MGDISLKLKNEDHLLILYKSGRLMVYDKTEDSDTEIFLSKGEMQKLAIFINSIEGIVDEAR